MATLEVALEARSFAASVKRDVEQPLDRARDASTRFVKSTDDIKRGMDSTGTSAGRLQQTLKRLLATYVGFQAIRSAVSTIATFEERITLTGQVARATSSQLELLESTAREFGASTRFTASEAADGLLFLARAGFTVQESVAALPATLNLAQVGMISLGDAADQASNIVSQFGLAAEETVRVVDSLVIASNRSNTSVAQAAQAMSYAGTVLGGLGIQVEEAANLIGVLGDRGIQAERAGTALRSVFLKLQAPTALGQKALEKYGISARDVDLRTNDVADVLDRLRPLLRDTAAAVQLFDLRNVAAAQTLALSTDRLRELNVEQNENRGEAERVARAVDDTLVGAYKNLTSAVQEGVLQLGDRGLTGAMRFFVDTLSGAVRVLTQTTNAENMATTASIALAAGIEAIAAALALMAVRLVAVKLTAFISSMQTAAAAAGGFRAALVAAAGPVGLLAGAAVAAVAGISAYTASTREASIRTREFADEVYKAQNRTVEGAAQFDRLKFDVERAIEFGDTIGQAAALNTQAKLLEDRLFDLKKEAEETGKALKGVNILDADRAGLGLGFDFNVQPKFDFREVARVLPEEQSRALAERLGLDFEQALKNGSKSVSREAFIEAIEGAVGGLRAEASAITAVEIPIPLKLTPEDKAIAGAREELERIQDELAFEATLVGQSANEQQRLRYERELMVVAMKAQIDNADELVTSLGEERLEQLELADAIKVAEESRRRAIQAHDQEIAAQERQRGTIQQSIEGLRFEQELVGLTNVERQRAISLRYLEAQATNLTTEEREKLIETYAQEFDRLVQLEEKVGRQLEIQRQLAAAVGDSLRSGIEDAIIELDNLEEIGLRVFEEIRRAAVRAAVAAAFGGQGTPFQFNFAGGGKDGLAFGSGGRYLPGYQRGGIISEPGFLQSAEGLRPVAEVAPEAVMPLARGPSGRLGVEVANPDSGGSIKSPVQVVMNINGVSDAASFRKSQRQIVSEMQRSLNRRGGGA